MSPDLSGTTTSLTWPAEVTAQISQLHKTAPEHVGTARNRSLVWQGQLTRAATAIHLGAGRVRLAALRGHTNLGEFFLTGTKLRDELMLTASLTLLATDPQWHAEMVTAFRQAQINPRTSLGAALLAADARAGRSDWPVLREMEGKINLRASDHLTDAALACTLLTLLTLCGLGGLEGWPRATDPNHVNFSGGLSINRLHSRWEWITDQTSAQTLSAIKGLWSTHLHTLEEE